MSLITALDHIQNLKAFQLLCLVWLWLGIISAIGFYFGYTRKVEDKKTSNNFTTNIFALMAFIMGFSFSMAVARFEARKLLVVEEANAIGTAYLQSKIVAFKNPQKIKNLFITYVDKRIEAYKSVDPRPILKELDVLENDIWTEIITVTGTARGPIEGNFVKSVNELFDTANARKLAHLNLLPSAFYFLILLLATVSMWIVNFDNGLDKNSDHWKIGLFIFLFGIIFAFIFDLDHSRSGIIQVGQNALIELRSKM